MKIKIRDLQPIKTQPTITKIAAFSSCLISVWLCRPIYTNADTPKQIKIVPPSQKFDSIFTGNSTAAPLDL